MFHEFGDLVIVRLELGVSVPLLFGRVLAVFLLGQEQRSQVLQLCLLGFALGSAEGLRRFGVSV